MSKGNGRVVDEGLIAINKAFEGAKYLDADAKAAAELMKVGKHRELEISDAQAMELYALVTEGKKFQIDRRNSKGDGYRCNVESYADLHLLCAGELEGETIHADA